MMDRKRQETNSNIQKLETNILMTYTPYTITP